MKCPSCKADGVVYRQINASGSQVVCERCPECGRNTIPGKPFLPKGSYDWDSLPLFSDATITAHPCEVRGCTNKGTQLHHFFPKYLFSYADDAPTAYLCMYHHMQEWHKKLTPNMTKHKDSD